MLGLNLLVIKTIKAVLPREMGILQQTLATIYLAVVAPLLA